MSETLPEHRPAPLQFRLSTLLLGTALAATSLALAGGWGVFLALGVLLLTQWLRAGAPGGGTAVSGCFFLLVGMCLSSSVFLGPSSGSTTPRMACRGKLKHISLALLNYCGACLRLPPPGGTGGDGQPMVSWRVSILPYLEQNPLYKSYRLDEPWNGPHNCELAALSLSDYACPGRSTSARSRPGETSYVAVVGPGTAWSDHESGHPKKPMEKDRRVLLVEVQDAGIAWSQPKDLTVDEAVAGLSSDSALRIASRHDRRLAHALLADGSVVELPRDLPPELLRIGLTEDIERLYEHFSEGRIDMLRWKKADEIPGLLLCLAAWIVSAAVFVLHGTKPARVRQAPAPNGEGADRENST